MSDSPAIDTCVCAVGAAVSCTTSCGSVGSGTCTATCAIPSSGDCAAPMEMCNGSDDDCDGVIDESDVITTGRCVGNCTYAPAHERPAIVGLAGGTFGIISVDRVDGQLRMQRVASDGTALGASTGLGLVPFRGHAVAFDGNVVLVAAITGTADPYQVQLLGASPTTGAVVWGPVALVVPSGRRPVLSLRFTDVSAGRATLYVPQFSTTTGVVFIHRYRVDTSGSTPSVLTHVDAVTDGINAYDVATVGMLEFVVYVSGAGNIDLANGFSGDRATPSFNRIGTVQTALEQPGVVSLAAAVHAPVDSLSGANPLAIAWQRARGQGSSIAYLATIGSSRPATVTTLPGSTGAAAGVSTTWRMRISPTGTSTGAFYVSGLEADSTDATVDLGRLTVWATSPTSTPRALDVPGETSAVRREIGMSASGAHLWIAEENGTGSIVTRAIGCN